MIAWQLGEIEHEMSEGRKAIVYASQFDKDFTHRRRRTVDMSGTVNYLRNNFNRLLLLAKSKQYKELFVDLCNNTTSGFGSTCIINLLFFFSKGKLPIYDSYVNKAITAINKGYDISTINFTPIAIKIKAIPVKNSIKTAWTFYQTYIDNLKEITGTDKIERPIDRTLWVYGHSFSETSKQNKKVQCR